MPSNPKRPIEAEDLYRFQLIRSAHLSPNGAHALYTLERVNPDTEKKHHNIWIVPTRDGGPKQFTFGDHQDRMPKWAPDGRTIAFLSNRANEEQFQIYLISFGGGEARRLTDLAGEFGSFAWSPDGRRVVCQFRQKDPAVRQRESDERKEKLGEVDRHITRVFYKHNDHGFLPQERWHLWVIDISSGTATQLTTGDTFDELTPSWAPDGQDILFTSNCTADPDLNPDAVDLYIISSTGGTPRRIPTPYGAKTLPAFSPDGRLIAYFGNEGGGDWWRNLGVWVVPADGSAAARDLTASYDIHAACHTANDTGNPTQMPPTWTPNGNRLFFQIDRHGCTNLQSLSLDGELLEPLIDDPGVVSTFHLDRQGETLLYFFGSQTDPGHLRMRDLTTGHDAQLTRHNEDLLNSLDLGETEEVWFTGTSGNDLQGWILKPPGFDPEKKYPSILEIHGGPLAQYGNFFMHEFFFLAAQGYVVYYCNPRGGQGYGEAHAQAIWNGWGTVDYEDLMTWSDLVAARPYIDHERMGVTGGSYGGYMTNWIIGHTDRFAAAVTQRCVSNLTSFWGSSDFNWVFQEVFGDVPPWEDIDNYWRMSPMKYMGNARTPTLVIHSEEDHRCPIEQGEQVFVALQRLGIDSEMVRFPGESHELSRSGRTDRRIARLNHIRRWFDRHTKK